MARFLSLPLALFALLVLLAQGCGSDPDVGAYGSGGKGGDDDGKICLLNNCGDDSDCADCSGSKTICLQSEKRCIACGPDANGKACKAGTYCTKYGDCVPQGVTCDESADGIPTGSCKSTSECAACGPKFRVCSGGKCAGCTAENLANCQSTDVCINGACSAKCPSACATDDQCGQCGLPGKEVHACNKHVCAQCSPTTPCPDGGRCDLDHGTCIKPCGLGRPGKTNCETDANCAGCQATTSCDLPVNGGEGTCVVPATGCSELGKGIFVLPEPFDRVTQACSGDADCANISADLNVGKILRDVTGLKLIKDGNIPYSMHACASVDVIGKLSCGVCVPCKQDTDCTDIDITKVAGDAFGKIGSVAAKLLLDKAFGPNDKKVHMYCQNVAGDYGACLPCPNLLARCAQTSDSVPTSGACDHDVCGTGTAMGVQCDPCVAQVCAKDPYCCTKEWDLQCKTDVDLYCAKKTCEPDKCVYRPSGWYCKSEAALGGYRCAGETGAEQIAEGSQCAGNQECRTTDGGPKSPAQLCTTESENDPQCPLGKLGKPKCFAK